MRLVLHPDAVAEATAAGDWYEARRPGLGADFAAELDRALELIADAPRSWPAWPGVSTALAVRRLVLPRFPFAVAYVVRSDEIVVLAVAHARRRPGYWARRGG